MPSASDANDVIFVLPPAILMEATRVNLSFSQTSMVPNFVPANMKSLLIATRWTSSPVDSEPTTILEDSENILHQLKEKLVLQENMIWNRTRTDIYLSCSCINRRTTSKEQIIMNLKGVYGLFSQQFSCTSKE